ncbi:MAG: FlgK family flagellar hook-associated protein, partial [Steroidobacteraceae bacterium]
MSGMLSTGLNGLRAFQLAIDVTSQNVVNANTDGYVRQRAELATRPAVPSAGAWLASGVQVARIAREVDVYRVAQSRDAATQAQNAATRMQEIGRVVAALGRGQDGLPGALQRVRDALEALTAAPATRSVRVELLAKLDDAATEIRAVDARWRDFDREWGQRMTTLVGELNADARAIADLNRQIAIGAAAAGTPSPTLLDQRDQLLDRLAGYADLRVVEDAEGKVNVFAGRGRALVVGDVATAVKAEDFAADSGGTLGALAYSR